MCTGSGSPTVRTQSSPCLSQFARPEDYTKHSLTVGLLVAGLENVETLGAPPTGRCHVHIRHVLTFRRPLPAVCMPKATLLLLKTGELLCFSESLVRQVPSHRHGRILRRRKQRSGTDPRPLAQDAVQRLPGRWVQWGNGLVAHLVCCRRPPDRPVGRLPGR